MNKKKVTFKNDVTYENADLNEKHEYVESPFIFQREENENSYEEEELEEMLRHFNPLDFGIKEKLSESEKKILVKEIMGRSKKCTMKNNDMLNEENKSYENTKERKKQDIFIHDNIIHMNDNVKKEIKEEDQNGSNSKENDNKKKKKKKKKKKNDNDKKNELSYLDGDCYFPNDGYDYEQHLKPISKNFIEIKNKTEQNFFEIQPNNEEEKELFKTFDMDNYEELNDNFVCEAQNVEEVGELKVDKKLIWGNVQPFLYIPSNDYMDDEEGMVNTDKINDNINDNICDKIYDKINDKIYDKINSDDVFSTDSDTDNHINKNYNNHNNINEDQIIFDDKLNDISLYNNQDISTKNYDEKGTYENNMDSIKFSDLVEYQWRNNLNPVNDIKKIIKKKKKGKNVKLKLDDIIVNINDEDKKKIMQIVNLQNEEIRNQTRYSSKGNHKNVENENVNANENSNEEQQQKHEGGGHYYDDEDSYSENLEHSSSSLSYDCETILTTKTNTTNHPYKLIIPKQIKPTPLLLNSQKKNENDTKNKNKNKNEDIKLERYMILEKIKTTRDKNETLEEKKERKKAVKEAQRLNRKLKKENSLLMKHEKKLMDKNINPFDIRDNVKYIKL
ncbi:conserved Plasmodium protein, unknown function [Plasmodium reichenowi]|uniref:Protein LTV1 homolog n=1 Tax=Plasmodium reichenowi TaxID=5854 RepID=A0A2P9D2W4_PLARE|nr:conserved Plasmodium protein, unknown function [Plasmodium reichenowi]